MFSKWSQSAWVKLLSKVAQRDDYGARVATLPGPAQVWSMIMILTQAILLVILVIFGMWSSIIGLMIYFIAVVMMATLIMARRRLDYVWVQGSTEWIYRHQMMFLIIASSAVAYLTLR